MGGKKKRKKEIAIDCLFTVDSISIVIALVFKSFEIREKKSEKNIEREAETTKGRDRQGKRQRKVEKDRERDGEDGEKG